MGQMASKAHHFARFDEIKEKGARRSTRCNMEYRGRSAGLRQEGLSGKRYQNSMMCLNKVALGTSRLNAAGRIWRAVLCCLDLIQKWILRCMQTVLTHT